MELLFGDLLNRLESTNTIHLETHLNEICNKKLIENIMRAPRKEKQELFDSFSRRALAKMEAMGKNRAELLLGQLEAVSSVSSTRKIKEVK